MPRDKQSSIEEPGPPARPQLPQRLIVTPDPPQHANRPLPPTPRSSGSPAAAAVSVAVAPPQQPAPQQPSRNSQNNMFKPVVSNNVILIRISLLNLQFYRLVSKHLNLHLTAFKDVVKYI